MSVPRSVSDEVLLEFIHIGKFVKVCAVCASTGTEVSIVGDPKAGQEVLKNLAVRKLRMKMAKKESTKLMSKNNGIVV